MKMVRLFIIYYLMMLDTSQEALIEKIHSSNREKDINGNWCECVEIQ